MLEEVQGTFLEYFPSQNAEFEQYIVLNPLYLAQFWLIGVKSESDNIIYRMVIF